MKITNILVLLFIIINIYSCTIFASPNATKDIIDPTDYDPSAVLTMTVQGVAVINQEYYCIINDNVYGLGELISDYIITDISDHECILQNDDEEVKKLSLY